MAGRFRFQNFFNDKLLSGTARTGMVKKAHFNISYAFRLTIPCWFSKLAYIQI